MCKLDDIFPCTACMECTNHQRTTTVLKEATEEGITTEEVYTEEQPELDPYEELEKELNKTYPNNKVYYIRNGEQRNLKTLKKTKKYAAQMARRAAETLNA